MECSQSSSPDWKLPKNTDVVVFTWRECRLVRISWISSYDHEMEMASLLPSKIYKHNGPKRPIKTCNHSKPILRKNKDSDRKSIMEKIKRSLHYTVEGNKIDRYSRFLFPFCYSLFLTIYFVGFTFGSQAVQNLSEGEIYL